MASSKKKFAMIPPLPSSHRSPLHNAGSSSNINLNSSSSTSKQPSSSSLLSSRRVLRYGETMESVFLIDSQSDKEYIKLCRSIVDGEAVDDAQVWQQVLEMASETSTAQQESDLLRLHRRATSRLSGKNQHVLAIWLSYAKAQARNALMDDARLTLKHIQQMGGDQTVSYYLVSADIELAAGDGQAAQDVLKAGIQSGSVDPVQPLLDRLAEIKLSAKRKPSSLSLDETSSSGDNNNNNNKRTKLTTTTTMNNNKRAREVTNEPVEDEVVVENENDVSLLTIGTADSNMSLGTEGTVGSASEKVVDDDKKAKPTERPTAIPDFVSKPKDKLELAEKPATGHLTPDTKNDSMTVSRESENTLKLGSLRQQQRASSVAKSSSFSTRPPALPRASLLSSAGKARASSLLSRPLNSGRLLGTALRVDPNDSSLLVDSDSENDATRQHGTEDRKTEHASKDDKKSRRITKKDLSYMFEWDPNKRSRGDDSSTFELEKDGKKVASSSPSLSRIAESPSTGSPHSGAEGTTRGSGCSVEACGDKKEHAREPESSSVEPGSTADATPARRPLHQTTAKSHGKPPSDLSALVSKVNHDFLPLVSEDNMLRVNGVPYAKLGVIGKGGSCKVYRALSKDCSVVAIKKVKLAGMDKKQMSGYANEIELLKRLRGNPAIIQMYDSEIDLSRKAIFMVMEVGEVDLNQVLQQQARSSGTRRNLNMNFIRLTWHQMLTAVHCIHEARIVHSDLKPANFLFVRGALKLIDFGIAKAIQSDDTTNIYRDTQIGTMNYMSPEAIQDTGTGMKMGRASDIWSLGCILYQMVYGKTPFADLHMIQKLQAIINPNYQIAFPANVDEDAIDAMKQCLRRKAEERPPIVGPGGLLTEHRFLNSYRRS